MVSHYKHFLVRPRKIKDGIIRANTIVGAFSSGH
jgi:hypothetical protein